MPEGFCTICTHEGRKNRAGIQMNWGMSDESVGLNSWFCCNHHLGCVDQKLSQGWYRKEEGDTEPR